MPFSKGDSGTTVLVRKARGVCLRMRLRATCVLLVFLVVVFVIFRSLTGDQNSLSSIPNDELEDLLKNLDKDPNFVKETLQNNKQLLAKKKKDMVTPEMVLDYEAKLIGLEKKVEDLELRLAEAQQQNQDEVLQKRLDELEDLVASLNNKRKRSVVDAPPAIITTAGDVSPPSTTTSSSSSSSSSSFSAAPAASAADTVDSIPLLKETDCKPNEVFSPHCKTCMPKEKTYKDKINYVHIPKAAGSAFTIPVRSYLDCAPKGRGCWGNPALTVDGNVDCGGRMTGCYGLNPLKNRNSFLLLRDPLARLRSSFISKLFPSGNEEQKALVKSAKTLKEYSLIPGISNCQTKILNGKSCTDPSPVGDAEVATAKSRISVVDFLGLVEHYNTSVCLLYKTYGGLPIEEDFSVIKKSPLYRPEVPMAIDERLAAEQSERWDILVYNFAREAFMERLRKYGQPLVD